MQLMKKYDFNECDLYFDWKTGGTGWANVPMHPDVFISGRMHLTIDQVKTLIPILEKFIETGEI